MFSKTSLTKSRRRPESRNLGSMLVEFAVLLPAALVLIMGLIETGNLYRSWLTVQKAAQQGARYATTGQGEMDGNRLTEIVGATSELLTILPNNGDSEVYVRSWPGMNVSGEGRPDDPGQPCDTVEVKVLYTYDPITPLVGAVMPDPLVLNGSDMKVNEPWHLCGQAEQDQ